jgi:uncharacterized protein YbjT (DUF2867 family)
MRVIVTGATGMVGEGVLHECLQSAHVDAALIVNRKPAKVTHPKLKEIIHQDFSDLSTIAEQFRGYDACFFCLGVSSVGMKEDEYRKLTYDLTLNFARAVVQVNPTLTFIYVSGAGTDSSEKGRQMWARVKGKTENDLMKLPFKNVFAFRPAFIEPTKGLKNTLKLYRYVGWLIPIMRAVSPNYISSLREVGIAMINATRQGYHKQVIEVSDIKALARL